MKLIKMLQHAHASELAAYYAYQGHWESLSDPSEIEEVQRIQQEEMGHASFLKRTLRDLGSSPNARKDKVFIVIGKIIGSLCKVTGWYLPMRVAQLMERIGNKGYEDLALEAYEQGYRELGDQLQVMAFVELEHEIYFKNKTNNNLS